MVNVIFEIVKKETASYYSQKITIIRNILFLVIFSYIPINQMIQTQAQYGYTASVLSVTLNVLLIIAAFFPVSMASGIAVMAFPAEKDQKTLEHLLSLPLSDSEIFLGKFLAALITGLAGLVLVFSVVIGFALLYHNIVWDAPLLSGSLSLMVFAIAPMLVILLILSTVAISSHISARETYIVNIFSIGILLALNVAVVTLNIDAFTFNLGLTVVLAAAIAIMYVAGTRMFSRERLITSL